MIVLNQVITNRATETYQTLQSKITPAINILTKYESINKELNLLTKNRVKGDVKTSTINRFKGIVEVELPHIKRELLLLKEDLPKISIDKSFIEKIITDTAYLINSSNNLNNLLVNKNEDQTNIAFAEDIWDNEIQGLYLALDISIRQLHLNYSRSYETYNIELTDSLKAVSQIILITGIIGILLGVIITIHITSTISAPISRLKNAVLMISKGRLDEQIQITGKNELAELGNSFNNMSTALKKSFNEQEKQIDQIKSMNKELEQFVYVASHDLQEPLRTMSSYLGLIGQLYQDQLDEDALKYMKHVEDASLRMKILIRDLLDYSRLGKEKIFKQVDCNLIVQDILTDLELIIKENNASIYYKNLPKVFGLEVELKQLFQNLISNGLKFKNKDISPEIEINVIDKSDYWLFSVKDNGIGMDEKHFKRVFVIFQRLNNRKLYSGTGIGLSICRKIVDLHNGDIWIESELGKGSVFNFTIKKS